MGVQEIEDPLPSLPTDPAYYSWSIQGKLTAIDLSLTVLALVTVLTRLYIRLFVLHIFRFDDYFIVAAMVREHIQACERRNIILI